MQILNHFKQTGALLDVIFYRAACTARIPAMRAGFTVCGGRPQIGRAIAERFTNESIETVASPAIGGLVIVTRSRRL